MGLFSKDGRMAENTGRLCHDVWGCLSKDSICSAIAATANELYKVAKSHGLRGHDFSTVMKHLKSNKKDMKAYEKFSLNQVKAKSQVPIKIHLSDFIRTVYSDMDAGETVEEGRRISQHYQSTCTPKSSISKFPLVTPVVSNNMATTVLRQVTQLFEYDCQDMASGLLLYDLSAITFAIEEERRSFLHFITRLCAVLGGTSTLIGYVD
ncbi:hypothetical protein CTI12_AA136850 [Artemisia annua]|uniref:Endoplasmic reticulum vesicle transporter C-terminal domain-containing protein n=1 Tax=Artemisia annua TaxID=35608 RepID=A0A2U1PLR9_ARTAN|nr:hypothetical protein CTI12_AA136850 [Artemisia annua]